MLTEMVWQELGPNADVAWPADMVAVALAVAHTIVWADSIRPWSRQTIALTGGKGTVPAGFWPLDVVTQGVEVDCPTASEVEVWPDTTPEIVVEGMAVPPSNPDDAPTDPLLSRAVAQTAAALLLMQTLPDAASVLMEEAEKSRLRVMAEWRNRQEWRIAHGGARNDSV